VFLTEFTPSYTLRSPVGLIKDVSNTAQKMFIRKISIFHVLKELGPFDDAKMYSTGLNWNIIHRAITDTVNQ